MVTYEQFVETCLAELVDEANTAEAITGQLTALKTKYEKSPIWKNKALEQIFAHYDHTIRSETEFNSKHLEFCDFREEFKRLDKYLNTLKSKDKKERAKLQKKIKDLQTRIKKDLRKIDRLDQSEISLEDLDNENSDHMKKHKYEQRVKRLSNKLLRLQGTSESTRLLDKVYKYNGTQYKELNEIISNKYRAIMQKKYKGKIPQRPINSTPSIADIKELIENFSTEKKITIPNPAELAFNITTDVIREVQRRRELELHEMMNDYEHDSHLTPTSIPDLADEELNRRLVSNEEKCRDSFIKKRDELKKKLDNAEVGGDIGGDEEGTASEEDDDDDTMEDGIDEDEDEDEASSEDEAMQTSEGNLEAEEDEDDDPILLNESGTALNGDDPQAPEASDENKKRPIDTNGAETNGGEPSKKIKVTESQVKEESNSEEKQETSGEQNGEVEKKEEKLSEEIKEKEKSNEDQSISISSESKEVIKKESEKISEETTTKETNESEDKPISRVETNQSKPEATDGEVKTDSIQPTTTKSESDDSIKIVDLEAENRGPEDQCNNVDDDDDDVICLD